VNYQLRYLSKQLLSAYEDTNSLQGRPAQNTDYSDIIYYPSVVYHDIRLGLNVTETSSFYFGVDNFANKRPPLGSTGIGEGSAIFEPVGRRFYAGVNARF
jgi:outer membrane receptor protein involved in Fe transport